MPFSPLRTFVAILAVLQAVMLAALMAGLQPHPPATTPLFAMGPFLGASIALAVAAMLAAGDRGVLPIALSVASAFTALLSFGPQKWFDPAIPQIWPAVLLGQIAAAAVLVLCWNLTRRRPA